MSTVRSPRPLRRVVLAVALALAMMLPASAASAAPARSSAGTQRVVNDATFLGNALNNYWTAQLQQRGMTFDTPDALQPYARTGNPPCDGQTFPGANNAYYCPANGNNFVAYDVAWFTSELARYPGDATTFIVLSHEWGHAVQDSWIRQAGGGAWATPYNHELNADCLAGVFLNDAVDSGIIREEAGDAAATYQSLYEGGSGTWFNPGDHGTSEQRQQAFTDGLRNDLDFCRQRYN